jgi:L-malate glycosyltransferase
MTPLHIGIAGPIATRDVACWLDHPERLPSEMQASTLLATLIGELLSRGHRVSAFSLDPSLAPRVDSTVCDSGGRFTMYCAPIRRRSMRTELGVRGRILDLYGLERAALVAAMQKASPDVIHAHWQYEYGWAAIDSGLPHVVSCHDAPWRVLRLMPNIYRFGRLLMARHVLGRARVVTAVSPYLAEAVSSMTRASIEVVPNALACASPLTSRQPRRVPLPSRAAHVLMILSGWGKLKNAESGLMAMQRLQQLRPETQCHLVGPDFAPGQAGERWIAANGLARNFHQHGKLTAVEVQSLLERMDLLIHPSLEESFGMTVAEAMSHGIPVVAGARSGGVPWVTGDGAAGRLVNIRSAVQISDAALALLDSPTDYRRCSEQGLARAHDVFSARVVADAYEALYRRASSGVSVPPNAVPWAA